jgi:RHS repeat-associated protein
MTGKVKGSKATAYEWSPMDHLTKAEGPTETTTYAYDGLERLSERKGGAGTKVFHYGDLADLPTYLANGEGETTTSYVQGARGLAEQRAGEATSYPLADAHGNITAITGPAGEVESRQSYGPWGEVLSGPGLEMGYLGAWERPTDTTTALIQMGARTYDPALGRFASEDPVPGHLGLGESVDRYLYVRDNPLNWHDLDGRDVCLFEACASEAAEDVGNAATEAWNTGKYVVTHPQEAATNAVEYWAASESPAATVLGPLAVLGDMAVNPSRAAYYLEKENPTQMAATGLLAAGTVGIAGVTVIATESCLDATAGFEAAHVCGQIAGLGGGISAAGAVLTVEVAKR